MTTLPIISFRRKIIRSLHGQGKPVTVGMEMVDVTQQAALDEYLEKKISWSEFARRTAFDRGWGKDLSCLPAHSFLVPQKRSSRHRL